MQQWIHSDNVRLVGVTAAGGYGKSALVAKLCEQLTDFPQQIWTSFSDAYPFAVWGRWLLDELGKPAPEKPEDLLIAVCNCLQTERYLLVLDNLETLQQNEQQWQTYLQFLLRWFSSSSKSVILVTSREQPTLPNNTLNQSHWLPLSGLATDAGVQLLQALEIKGAESDLVAFVNKTDGHPLLLKLVAGWLKAEEGEEADISLLKSDIFSILGLHQHDPEASIAKILDASLQRLEPGLQNWLHYLSVYRLAFDCSAAMEMSLGDFADETEVKLQLRKLAKRSLLQEKKQQGVLKFYFPPLIQTYLQKLSSPAAHQCAIAYYEKCRKPQLLTTDKLDDVAEYLEIFHHHCELGEYIQAFSSIYYRENNHDNCDELLKNNYYFPIRLTLYERLYHEWQQPENTDELKRYSDLLKVYGDVLQFLKRSDQALERYEDALKFYRDIGARLGEANVLQEFGKLQPEPQAALEYLQSAQNLYTQIGSVYSQSRNLLFIADVQLKMADSDAAINSLNNAIALASTINYAPLQESAQNRIAEINSASWKDRLKNLFEQRWLKLALCFLLGLITFLLLRR